MARRASVQVRSTESWHTALFVFLLVSGCATSPVNFSDKHVYEVHTIGSKNIVNLGCTTAQTEFPSGQGKDCRKPENGPACLTTGPNVYIQSSLVVKRVPGNNRGYNPRCYVMPSDYKPYFGRGDVSEPSKMCFQVFASSPSGTFNAGETGQVNCEFTFDTNDRIGEPAVQ